MTEDPLFRDSPNKPSPDGKKPLDGAALALAIAALVFAPLVPIATYACGIVALIFAAKNKQEKRTTAALVIAVIALVAAVIVHIYNAVTVFQYLQSLR